MSGKYESPAVLKSKVSWEGGVVEAILGYGIKPDDLPDGTPEEVRESWASIRAVTGDVDVVEEWLNGIEDESDDDE
jgi:hypothetical protein